MRMAARELVARYLHVFYNVFILFTNSETIDKTSGGPLPISKSSRTGDIQVIVFSFHLTRVTPQTEGKIYLELLPPRSGAR